MILVDQTDVRRQWEVRSGEYSPAYYAYYGPNETSEELHGILEQYVDHDAHILELGCSSGRHLSHLFEHGFENLSGIDVNEDAFDVMEETYPDLATHGSFYHDAIEDVVTTFDDGQFDVVYSVETLQHLHPDLEWVFAELSRITDDLLVTVENEGVGDCENEPEDAGTDRRSTDPEVNYINDDFPLYYRNWKQIFTGLGFVEVDVRSGERDTVRTFRIGE